MTTTRRLLIILALGSALLFWARRSEPSVAGVWQTSDAGAVETRPTLILSRTGRFQFDPSGRGRARRIAPTARWELKDRALWIIAGGKREKLAEVAVVTATSMILCLEDVGVQEFTRVGDGD
jgi:hypothetical protein